MVLVQCDLPNESFYDRTSQSAVALRRRVKGFQKNCIQREQKAPFSQKLRRLCGVSYYVVG